MNNLAIKNIFLADDNKHDCLSFEKAIIDIKARVQLTTVTNGEELMHLLGHYVPELLFLDLEMPLKNGMQCLKAIRENKAFERLPVVVFTATDRPNNIQMAYGFGANLFLTKPFAYPDLVSSLKQILQMDWSKPELITECYFTNNKYQAFRL